MRPASSMIWASMIPGRSLKSVRLAPPLVTTSTASRLQSGQSDRVRRGTPVAIGALSQLLGRGLGAQDGCGSLPCGKIELTFLAKDHATLDNDLVKLADWADIVRILLCGFTQRREYRKLQQHGGALQRKWLAYSNPELRKFGKKVSRVNPGSFETVD